MWLVIHIVADFAVQREVQAAEFLLLADSQADRGVDGFEDDERCDQRIDCCDQRCADLDFKLASDAVVTALSSTEHFCGKDRGE